MKKIPLFFLLICILCSTQLIAQNKTGSDDSGDKCFNGSTKVLNLGVGLSGGSYYSSYSSRSPAFSLSYEQGLPNKIGPGYMGIGGYLGYQTARYYNRYDYKNSPNKYFYEHRWNTLLIMARAAYHLDVLNTSKAELYAGASLGVRIQTYSYEDNDPYYDYQDKAGRTYLASSLFIGGRYYFTKNIGIYAEFGYGISYATVGVSIKF